MSSSSVARIEYIPPTRISSQLRSWYDSLPALDCISIDRIIGHSMSFLSFQVLEGFIERMLTYWVLKRHVFFFRSDELSPTLEEYERITELPLDGPCARVAAGEMRRKFMAMTGLRQSVILGEITYGHMVSLDFLIDHF